jgi:MoxR-like ATPase
MDAREIAARVDALAHAKNRMLTEMRKCVVGQDKVLLGLLASIFSNGHCLIVGVPGLAKTLMVKTLAAILDLSFKRVQFTPDLMPSDITGTDVLDETETRRREFKFMAGPIFANIVLADEINRTPPKTQAALLEAMQERQVTVGKLTYRLPDPFFVAATENPIEQEGTYPLPEAQLDRFMFNLFVEYPGLPEEEEILSIITGQPRGEPAKVLDAEEIKKIQEVVNAIAVSPYVVAYTTRLIRATRPNDDASPSFTKELVEWGAGPRAGQHLIQGSKAIAALDGRYNVAIDDIREMAVPVLRHRISVNFQAQSDGVDSTEIIRRLIKTVPEGDVSKYERR